jgi:ADP-heptose:LPS heptosyltransferase
MRMTTDLVLDADYRGAADLFRDWAAVRNIYDGAARRLPTLSAYEHALPAVPPFYWSRCAAHYRNAANAVRRPPDAVFYHDEQDYYLAFARALGYAPDARPVFRLPIAASARSDVTPQTVIIAPGCKTGEMAAKRWPHFPELAERFSDIALVGTADDLRTVAATVRAFPGHVRSFVDKLSLRATVELLASAGAAVGNDSGLSHAAAATGAPTVMLFGPTPHLTLGQLPPNVTVLRTGLACEPCWTGARLRACSGRVDCLRQLSVDRVESSIRALLGLERASTKEECADVVRHRVRVGAATEAGPRVSCIMPTCDRRALVPRAVSQFLRQDYPNRELIVLDDGTDAIQDLLPDDVRIRYERLGVKLTLGAKRNLGCERASGELIAHWDDDDWMADWRLSYQARWLWQQPNADVCGLQRLFFYDAERDRAWEYIYPPGGRTWVAGGTMCFRRAFWQRHRFPDVNEGEDTRFLWAAQTAAVMALPDNTFYVAMIHAKNTSRKRIDGSRWHLRPPSLVRDLMAAGCEAASA